MFSVISMEPANAGEASKSTQQHKRRDIAKPSQQGEAVRAWLAGGDPAGWPGKSGRHNQDKSGALKTQEKVKKVEINGGGIGLNADTSTFEEALEKANIEVLWAGFVRLEKEEVAILRGMLTTFETPKRRG